MGASATRFKTGDVVIIDINSLEYEDVIIKMQERFGRWTDEMKECITSPSSVINAKGEWITIQTVSGQTHRMNLELFKKYSDCSDSHMLRMSLSNLMLYIDKGDLEKVKQVIDITGPNVIFQNFPPLVRAAEQNSIEIIHYLIEKGSLINVVNEEGNTALHYGVINEKLDICEFLVDKGANLNIQNQNHLSPIMLSVNCIRENILDLLTSKIEANLNLTDSNDETALHMAVAKCKVEHVEILLVKGADMMTENKKNMTPFHVASADCNYSLYRYTGFTIEHYPR